MLANTAPLSFELGSFGEFRTLENAWVFFRGGALNERAKMARGKELETLRQREPRREVTPFTGKFSYLLPYLPNTAKDTASSWFRHHILLCLHAKITQNQQLKDLLILSHHNAHLPFVRYYYDNHDFGRDFVEVREQSWFIEGLLALREALCNGQPILTPVEA